jgi:hypothetical protein
MNASDGANPAAIVCSNVGGTSLPDGVKSTAPSALPGTSRKSQPAHTAPSSRSDVHSIESDRALIKSSICRMAMRKKGKKVQDGYNNFSLRL